MDDSPENEIIDIWDEFVDAGYEYIDSDGTTRSLQGRKAKREERIPHLKRLVDRFLSGDTTLLELRRGTDSESKQHNYWGFKGTSQMFFNMYCNAAERQNRIEESTSRLRETIDPPSNSKGAAERIERFEAYVEQVKSDAENKRKAPQAGFIPAFVSFFWQVQQPDGIPVYYESARKGYEKLGIWKPQGELSDSYADFWRTTDSVRKTIRANRDADPSLWAVEYAVLRYTNRTKAASQRSKSDTGDEGVEVGKGTTTGHERSKPKPTGSADRIETYADFETTQQRHIADELAIDVTGLYFENLDEILTRSKTALANGNHVLFIGPPGTGKTKLARQVCRSTVGDSFSLVTATADWSTFDTIGGYQPTTQQELEFKPGIFLSRFQDSKGDPKNEWLIIDEINRADIDKAFGSLFSALTDEDVTLPFVDSNDNHIEILGDPDSRERSIEPYRYYIPENWRMVATMNTLDKTSLYEMSYAFMRRWAFVHIGVPERDSMDSELVEQYVAIWDGVEIDESLCEVVATMWKVSISSGRSVPRSSRTCTDIYKRRRWRITSHPSLCTSSHSLKGCGTTISWGLSRKSVNGRRSMKPGSWSSLPTISVCRLLRSRETDENEPEQNDRGDRRRLQHVHRERYPVGTDRRGYRTSSRRR